MPPPSASAVDLVVEPLAGATFGGRIRLDRLGGLVAALRALEARPDALARALHAAGGLLVLPALREIAREPELLVRLSRLLGPEVEDYHTTLADRGQIHDTVREIYLVSNLPPTNQPPPAPPEPPLAPDGRLPVRFPQRRGWHTDQSFRRPPPDISLFYAVIPAPRGQGQTLYADGAAACEALPASLEARVRSLEGIHVKPGTGRSEPAVRAGETPQPLGAHEQPQRQPLVRRHPVTGRDALYLCEAGQMDWITGPIAGLEPGPDGEGARLLYEIMRHVTQPRFVYAHEWEADDLVVYDNRCLLHCATWFDAARHGRVMWRTTVFGNPGPEYAGERRSWARAPAAASFSR